MPWTWLVPLAALLLAALLLLWWRVTASKPVRRLDAVRDLFAAQRAQLHDDFFRAAAASGKPRGLRWLGCEWDDATAFARETSTGQFVALVGVTIRFEAIEGGDMEGLPAVANLRNAAAVFFFDGRIWRTAGRAVFNLNPDEAVRHFGKQYEAL